LLLLDQQAWTITPHQMVLQQPFANIKAARPKRGTYSKDSGQSAGDYA